MCMGPGTLLHETEMIHETDSEMARVGQGLKYPYHHLMVGTTRN